ncbi:hypothetical protein D3C74_179600 [compost metagenome]
MLKKRVLWILNHDTLSKFELPLLRDLGFEIFTPKIVPKEILQASGSVVYDYDCTLTIPEQDLEILNGYNFYENMDMPLYIKNILNKNFDTALVMFDLYALEKMVLNFKGQIFARAFGVGSNQTYHDILRNFYHESFLYKLEQIKDRFWFSQCYDNISEIEDGIIKEKALYMPLGLPSDFYEVEDQWTGELDKLLFFCTRIKYNSESEKIYNKFKSDFKGFDYLVAGNQPVPVDDPRVIGFLDRNELNGVYKKCKVMYYHSTLPRHVHYHPLEAMIAGMPVIFMEGSLLSVLGGKEQAGCCKDINEARKKVRRILDGDETLIEMIRRDQKKILYKFSYQYNKNEWEKNFLSIIDKLEPAKSEDIQTLAVFLSDKQSKVHIDDYVEMVKLLDISLKNIHPFNRLTFNVLQNQYDIDTDFSCLMEQNITVKDYSLKTISSEDMNESLALMFKKHEPLWHTNYVFPQDYAQNYAEADYWLFLNDNIDSPIASIKPYGLFIENVGDRFYKTTNSIRIFNMKKASFILTNSEQTKLDLVKHFGINEMCIFLIPFIFSKPRIKNNIILKGVYTLIEMDLSKLELVRDAMIDIIDYYRLFKSEEKLKIHFNHYDQKQTGSFLNEMSSYIQNNDFLKDKITMHVDLGINEYNALYANSKKVIIPHNINDINFKLAKAAFYSKQVVVNDFPFYKEFEISIGYSFDYRKFRSKKNTLLEVLTEPNNNESICSYSNSRFMPEYLVDEISQVWRKLL